MYTVRATTACLVILMIVFLVSSSTTEGSITTHLVESSIRTEFPIAVIQRVRGIGTVLSSRMPSSSAGLMVFKSPIVRWKIYVHHPTIAGKTSGSQDNKIRRRLRMRRSTQSIATGGKQQIGQQPDLRRKVPGGKSLLITEGTIRLESMIDTILSS